MKDINDREHGESDGRFVKGGGNSNADSSPKMEKEFDDFGGASAKSKNKRAPIMLPRHEYAAMCSAIRTRFGNKIPSDGNILYKDSYYEYTNTDYNIQCIFKMPIVGNEKRIKSIMEENDG